MSSPVPPPTLPPPPAAATSPATPARTSGLAVASLVLGILALLGGAVLILPTLLAIILGHVAMAKIRRQPTVLGGHSLALVGCILGYVSIVMGVVFAGLLAAMAIPAFQKVREASLEKMLHNHGRQIAAAAQQHMLEQGTPEVTFQIDRETGVVSGPLSTYIDAVTSGVYEVDGTVEADGTFSLAHPRVAGGRPITFTTMGEIE